MGVFHSTGWWPKTSCLPSKVCLPWVSKRGIWDVPGILPGCPGPLGVFKKFVQKNFVQFFSFPKKTAMEVVDFCGGFFWSQNTKKNSPKKSAENPPAENKESAGARPPRNPPVIPKKPPQNLPANPPVKPPNTHRVLSIKKDWSWRRLQSVDSGTLFGCLLDMVEAPMLKCTCKPSAAAGGMDKVCCAPFQTTLSVKSVCFEKTAQK